MKLFAKKVFDGGGGNYLKKREKSRSYLHKIFNNQKYFTKRVDQILKSRTEKICRGAVLIEFAICMPILIIMLFYINDLVKIKRYYSQTEFVGRQTANMIQNISRKRTDKAITKADLVNIHALSWKTVYPGLSMFRVNSVYPLSHKPITSIYYVKGLIDGKASCVWRIWIRLYEGPSKIGYNFYTNDNLCSSIRFLKDTSSSNIYPTLRINAGETKIIVETLVERDNSGNQYSGITDKAAMGLHFVSPPTLNKTGSWSQMFHSVVIFTPKPGLFSETPPS